MIKDEYKQFLLGPAAAGRTRHSGRMLYDHLAGTHDLLEAWGNSEPVCAAGLFHSIYGTKHFRHQSWPLDDRATIQKLVGPFAELLAYCFCTVNRPAALFGDNFDSDNAVVRPLREIEAANLIEQGSRSRWLKSLRDSDISDAAKRAVGQYLNKGEAA
jgi:hypothetical protein